MEVREQFAEQELVLAFHDVGLWIKPQVIGVGGKSLSPQSHSSDIDLCQHAG